MVTAVGLLGLLCAGAAIVLLGAFLVGLSRASSKSRNAAAPLLVARGAKASAKRSSADRLAPHAATDYTAPFGFAALQTTMMVDPTPDADSGGAYGDPGSDFADSTGDAGMDAGGPSFDSGGGGFDGGGGGFDGGGGFSDGGGATGSW